MAMPGRSAPRNLFVCCDGTWNEPTQLLDGVPVPTNVFKFHSALAETDAQGHAQCRYYHSGVGAELSFIEKMLAGATGKGLDQLVMSAYKWLCDEYLPGDHIYLLGFSRGAYTARSVAGFITRCGILNPALPPSSPSGVLKHWVAWLLTRVGLHKPPEVSGGIAWEQVEAAFHVYASTRRFKGYAKDSAYQDAETVQAEFRAAHSYPEPEIHFIGVWDTVGALGVPRNVKVKRWVAWLKQRMERYLRPQVESVVSALYEVRLPIVSLALQMALVALNGVLLGGLRRLINAGQALHDTSLSPGTHFAFHAIAMDERRTSFAPTLWTGAPAPGQVVEQVWFPGVHADVGGGYKEAGLADITLQWMIGKAAQCGAAFKPDMVKQLQPHHQGVLHDSGKEMHNLMDSQPREVPCVAPGANPPVVKDGPTCQRVSPVAVQRQQDPPVRQNPYWRTVRLAPLNEEIVNVFARQFWNETGLYLEAGGSYQFSAIGSWSDAQYVKGAQGWTPWYLPVFVLAWYWKRESRAKWFALVGMLGDEGNPDAHGSVRDMTLVLNGAQGRCGPLAKGGYLYCFANDAVPPFGFRHASYGNNRGSVQLKVTRLS